MLLLLKLHRRRLLLRASVLRLVLLLFSSNLRTLWSWRVAVVWRVKCGRGRRHLYSSLSHLDIGEPGNGMSWFYSFTWELVQTSPPLSFSIFIRS